MNRLATFIGVILLALEPLVAQNPYGQGTPGPGGYVPKLTSSQAWMGNGSFSFNVQNAIGGALAFLVLSFQPDSFAVGNVQVLASWQPNDFIFLGPLPLSGAFGVPGAGLGQLPMPLQIPPDPTISGTQFYSQVYVEDPMNPGAFSASSGLRTELTLPPLVFVGTSVGGSTDPWALVDPLLGTIVSSGGSNFSNNVSGAVMAFGGADLYLSCSITNSVTRVDLRGAQPAWSTFYTASGSCYGIGFDWKRRFVHTLAGPTATTRELLALDGDPSRATFGQIVAATSNITGGIGSERWGLSASGDRAAIPAVYLSPGPLIIVDTDPGSATFFQAILSTPVPVAGIAAAFAAAFTPDDEYVLVSLGGFGVQELARFHVPTSTWIDHNPMTAAIENIPLPGPPSGMDVAPDGSFAVLCGSGWVVRVDFDPSSPWLATTTPWLSGTSLLSSANGISLSRDGSLAAVTSLSPSKLLIIDTATGLLVNNVALPGFSNIYTTTWR